MSAENKVYQVSYLRDGREVLVGDEIMSIDTAARMCCPQGHKLRVTYRKTEHAANVWWLTCATCGEQTFVRRYEQIADPRNASTRVARLAKAPKAPASLIEEMNHHVQPFASVDAALEALIQEADALVGIEAAMQTMAVLEGGS